MKKEYMKPEAEKISFKPEEELMAGTTFPGASMEIVPGQGGILP